MTVNRTPSSTKARMATRRSLLLLWWIPLSPIVGFLVANRLFSESWPLWQVVPLVVALAAPFGVGAYYALRAIQLGDRKAWIPLAVHVAFMVVALVMPISESLT
ncbi:MAG TPA: hypothetical protein VFR23_14610 [Jiangellaceae bacterium]|nr:hypothetical protein [Jiangellaceae bacterium]